ncbi:MULTISPECIES: SDR family NAD(P)-dependent oxidoreductase [Rhizobium/Agrobacterium group]|uniref:SDR family NAD(P)-dependent oxidoreductase n=1 Tax=Rhizobium/Agrobacterium group TaxID=227290 RepID=UPI00157179D7|nr:MULTISPECIES: glucose 1-dehydrogenase [Rhizobium/Agrobacterium group]NTD86789.1 glucose 1-dehydrogenase [Agrobacterium tumefaciens]NTD91516.1 glucose 1-dehydrogenase [Agrobacterium tumefaciens]NTD96986.1 glucose 1-dehydrogenase [Agrobacterium tumefaciens]NTE11888.1 glucose 1-dehydrogenase [Agrobacterium tumefaciens]NTE24785.1 glucose 1-dehydrogenase [Agrobacterium tumefaciens]
MRLEGKVCIITGAARGIGRATTELFVKEGAKVHACDLSFDKAFEADNIITHSLDVTDFSNWETIVKGVIATDGRIDVLFNNAGTVHSYHGIAEIPIEDWHKVIAVNQTGPFYGMKAVIPHMKASGGGSIINTSSIWGIAGAAGVAAYTASKAAVRHMSKNAALTYVGDNIRVNSLHPGIIGTPMIDAQDAGITQAIVDITPMKRLGRPDEIAYGALFLASDESSYMTGAELVIDGGYTVP